MRRSALATLSAHSRGGQTRYAGVEPQRRALCEPTDAAAARVANAPGSNGRPHATPAGARARPARPLRERGCPLKEAEAFEGGATQKTSKWLLEGPKLETQIEFSVGIFSYERVKHINSTVRRSGMAVNIHPIHLCHAEQLPGAPGAPAVRSRSAGCCGRLSRWVVLARGEFSRDEFSTSDNDHGIFGQLHLVDVLAVHFSTGL